MAIANAVPAAAATATATDQPRNNAIRFATLRHWPVFRSRRWTETTVRNAAGRLTIAKAIPSSSAIRRAEHHRQ